MRSLLSKCIAASVLFHIVLLWVFFTHPLFLQPYLPSVFGKSNALPLEEDDIALSEKNVSLEEAFNQIITLAPHRQIPYDYEHVLSSPLKNISRLEKNSSVPTPPLSQSLPTAAQMPRGFFMPQETLKTPEWMLDVSPRQEIIASAPLAPFDLEKPGRSVLFDDIAPIASDAPAPSENTTSIAQGYLPTAESRGARPKTPPISSTFPPSPADAAELLVFADPKNMRFSDLPTPPISEPLAASFPAVSKITPHNGPLPALTAYGLPDSYATADWSSDFIIDVRTYKRAEGGYLFSLSLLPKYDMSARRMPQNILFLVDRTNTEGKHRFQTFKRAIFRALPFLREGDRFNIAVIGDRVQKMSELPVAFNKKTVAQAEDFLNKEVDVSSGGNVFAKLPKAALMNYEDSEAPAIVLLSDGGEEGKSEKQSRNIRAWVEQNKGEVPLYAATIGRENNTHPSRSSRHSQPRVPRHFRYPLCPSPQSRQARPRSPISLGQGHDRHRFKGQPRQPYRNHSSLLPPAKSFLRPPLCHLGHRRKTHRLYDPHRRKKQRAAPFRPNPDLLCHRQAG